MADKAETYLKSLLGNLKTIREKTGISTSELEERLILGPGWISRFETAEVTPGIDMLLVILQQMGVSLNELVGELPSPDVAEVERFIFPESKDNDLEIHFRYADFDASYLLKNAKIEEFETIIKTLREGLSELVFNRDSAANAVTKAFLTIWPPGLNILIRPIYKFWLTCVKPYTPN